VEICCPRFLLSNSIGRKPTPSLGWIFQGELESLGCVIRRVGRQSSSPSPSHFSSFACFGIADERMRESKPSPAARSGANWWSPQLRIRHRWCTWAQYAFQSASTSRETSLRTRQRSHQIETNLRTGWPWGIGVGIAHRYKCRDADSGARRPPSNTSGRAQQWGSHDFTL
jgi:hypothetical protein